MSWEAESPNVVLPDKTNILPSEKVNPSNERVPSKFILLSTCKLDAVILPPTPSGLLSTIRLPPDICKRPSGVLLILPKDDPIPTLLLKPVWLSVTILSISSESNTK